MSTTLSFNLIKTLRHTSLLMTQLYFFLINIYLENSVNATKEN